MSEKKEKIGVYSSTSSAHSNKTLRKNKASFEVLRGVGRGEWKGEQRSHQTLIRGLNVSEFELATYIRSPVFKFEIFFPPKIALP